MPGCRVWGKTEGGGTFQEVLITGWLECSVSFLGNEVANELQASDTFGVQDLSLS